jgi:hypothetical protein
MIGPPFLIKPLSKDNEVTDNAGASNNKQFLISRRSHRDPLCDKRSLFMRLPKSV